MLFLIGYSYSLLIVQQVQRYRERLVERLDDRDISNSKKSKQHQSKTSKSSASRSPHPGSHKKRHSQSRDLAGASPTNRRDNRDRSPPRSFRELDRPRRRRLNSSDKDDDSDGNNNNSPFMCNPSRPSSGHEYARSSGDASGRKRQRMSQWDGGESGDEHEINDGTSSIGGVRVRCQKRPKEELEEGEASDEEDCQAVADRTATRTKQYDIADSNISSSETVSHPSCFDINVHTEARLVLVRCNVIDCSISLCANSIIIFVDEVCLLIALTPLLPKCTSFRNILYLSIVHTD